MTAVDTSLPPALFDLEPDRREYVLTPFDGPFIPHGERLCALCRRKLRTLSCTHSCGGARDGGYFDLCDDCAATDLTPDGHLRWGITPEYLAIERLRRKVYAAGGGETEVTAAAIAAGLIRGEVAG